MIDDKASTAEQVSMADRVADKMYPRTHPGWIGGQACALAAIIETQEADAKTAEMLRWKWKGEIASAIRSGEYLEKTP